MHTGELSKLFEIDRTTLNYYVKKGLVHPHTDGNRYHAYSFSDFMALAYLRHYLGLGFHMEQIPHLFEEEEVTHQLGLIDERIEGLQEERMKLTLKELLLGNLRNILSYVVSHRDTLEKTYAEPYYFLPKQSFSEDSIWMDIYKMAPSIEFQLAYKEGEDIDPPDLLSSSGLSLKASWLSQLGLDPPEESIYYPERVAYLASFSLRGEHLVQDLYQNIRHFVSLLPEDTDFEEECVLYLFLTHYGKDKETQFECLCFFNPKQTGTQNP